MLASEAVGGRLVFDQTEDRHPYPAEHGEALPGSDQRYALRRRDDDSALESAFELHSGEYGGAVVNPATALARILASFHDDDWRIVVAGFGERCRDWPAPLRRELAELPLTEEEFRVEVRVLALGGEIGYSAIERRWMRPTFEVDGLLAGYTEAGGPSPERWRPALGSPRDCQSEREPGRSRHQIAAEGTQSSAPTVFQVETSPSGSFSCRFCWPIPPWRRSHGRGGWLTRAGRGQALGNHRRRQVDFGFGVVVVR